MYSVFLTNQKVFENKIIFCNLSNSFFFFRIKILKIRDSRSVRHQFYVSSYKEIGVSLKIKSKRAILTGPYSASKSNGNDATMTPFAANL